MEFRPLGETGLDVSILGLGTAQLGHVYGEIDEAVGERTVRTALDLGINLLDVSPYYGCAETVLGRALRGIPRDRYYLATKTGRFGLDEFDHSPVRIRQSLEESLRRLGVETIDLFHLHDVEFASLDAILEESIPAMEALKAEGKIRFFGVTGLPLRTLQRVSESSRPDALLSYCHYTLQDDALEKHLEWFAARGIGVLNASPTGMGLLTADPVPAWHPADAGVRAACQRAVERCEQQGTNITRLALQFACAEPRIASTIVGTASPEQITENVRWVEEEPDLRAIAEVREMLTPAQRATWSSGRPENN